MSFPNSLVACDLVWMAGHKARLRELHFWLFYDTVFATWERPDEYIQNSRGIIQILTTGRHDGEFGALVTICRWFPTFSFI